MKKILLLFLIVFALTSESKAQCHCEPPSGITAFLHDTTWLNVRLEWQYPSCMAPGEWQNIAGFNVYRNGTILNTTPIQRLYYSNRVPATGNYEYEIEAVWLTGCVSSRVSVEVVIDPDICITGITELPYVENFNGYWADYPTCWGNNSTEDGFPVLSLDLGNDKNMHFKSSSQHYNILTLPFLAPDLDIRDVQLSFSLFKISPQGSIEIGVMSDPDDASTIVSLYTLSPESLYSWEDFIVNFEEYDGEGAYIAFRSDKRNMSLSNEIYLDNITMEENNFCPSPTGLKVSGIGGNSALLTWVPGEENTMVKVEYSEAGTENWMEEYTSGNNLVLTYLEESTVYEVRISTRCGNEESLFTTGRFTTTCDQTIQYTIGDGTDNSYEIPLNNDNRYTLSQQIFLSSEMDGAQSVHGIAFEYSGISPMREKHNVSIYMAHTTKTFFTDNQDWDNTPLNLVYHGNLNCISGWNQFYFSSPFQYNGTDNLLIVIDDNSGIRGNNRQTFRVHSTNESLTIYSTGMYENPDMSDPYINDYYTLTTNKRNNVRFLGCGESSGCVPPNVIIRDIYADQADIQIISPDHNGPWTVDYKEYGDEEWIHLGIYANTEISLPDLIQGKIYHVRVSTSCDDNTYSDTVIRNFATPCGLLEILPLEENFDSYLSGFAGDKVPDCWNSLSTYADSYPQISTNFSVSPQKSLYLNATATTYTLFTVNELSDALDIRDLEVSFSVRGHREGSIVEVGVMTNPYDINTFTTVEAFPAPNRVWDSYSIPLNSYQGNGKYIAVKCDGRTISQTNEFYIDDFKIDLTFCPRPLNPVVLDITTNDFVVSWDGEQGNNYEVVFGRQGFDPDTAQAIYTTTDTFYSFGDITTDPYFYEVYVRSVCGGVTSNWTYPVMFSFQCPDLGQDDLPYMEDFENWGADAPAYPLPLCWQKLTNFPGNQTPYITENSLMGTSKFLVFDGNSENSYTVAILPKTSINVRDLYVKFRMSTAGTGYGLAVGVMTDPYDFDTFESVATVNPTAAFSWNDYEVYFNSYNGDGKYIAFRYLGKKEMGILNMVYLDDVEVRPFLHCELPSNIRVRNITPYAIQVAWQENGQAGNWYVEYGPAGFEPGEGNLLTANQTQYTFDDILTPSTAYDLYIYSECDLGLSLPSGPVSFVTKCIPYSGFPYYEDFEHDGEWPECWTQEYVNEQSDWVIKTGARDVIGIPDHAHSGEYNATFAPEVLAFPVTRLVAPVFDLDGVVNPHLNFWYAQAEDPMGHNNSQLTIYYKDSHHGEWQSIRGFADPVEEWTFVSLPLPNPTSTYYIAFEGRYNVALGNVIDDISITSVTCNSPQNLRVTDITNNGADVIWNAGGNETQWILEYKEENEVAYTQVECDETQYSLTGLTAETHYLIRVRAVCGENDSSFYREGYFNTVSEYIISATAGNNGDITPNGNITVMEGSSQRFIFQPHEGYRVDTIYINGIPTGSSPEYTFLNVLGDSTIHVTFRKLRYNITATSGPDGSINPEGNIEVEYGDSRVFSFHPDGGYRVLQVEVNGRNVNTTDSYTFHNIRGDSTIHVSFVSDEVTTYTITATAGPGGRITPSGTIPVEEGDSRNFTFAAETGYEIDAVLVNNVDRGNGDSYTITNVRGDSTIHVTFRIKMFIITATADGNGSIDPEGSIPVPFGDSQTFTFVPQQDQSLQSIWINGRLLESIPDHYTFTNVRGDSTIRVSFTIGITEHDLSQEIILYPNPTTRDITVKTEYNIEKFEITNMLGQVLSKKQVNNKQFRVDLSPYRAGIYFIRLYGEKGTVTKKVIKK